MGLGCQDLASHARPTDILKKVKNTPFVQPFTDLFNYTEDDASSSTSTVEHQTIIQGFLVCDHQIFLIILLNLIYVLNNLFLLFVETQ